jgi:GNAT superfamily N-acetyltransferase
MPSVPGGAAASCRGSGAESDMEPVIITWELPPLSVTIRPLEESDVRLLEWHGGADLRSFYDWQWEQHQAGEREVLVAVFNGFPIGQAAVHWAGKIVHPGVPDIQSLRVMDAFRGLKVGSRLMDVCELDVQRRGCGRIGLSVSIHNHAARRLYERLGYAADGPTYFDRWHYTNARDERVDVEEEVIDMLKDLPD